jgi:hypothetical protein
MKSFSILVMLSAWACLLWAPRSTLSNLAQILGFGALGALFTIAGVFSWWWDSGMQPGQRSGVVPFCGLLTLVAVVWVWLRSAAEDEFGPR